MAAGARRREVAKQSLEQLALKQPKGLRREPEAAGLLLKSLLLGNLAKIILHLLLQRAELIDVTRLGEFREHLHIDDADASRFASFFELLQELVDFFEFLLD